ncbi:MAG: hypothetical protein KDK45_17650 [Leptospiraceae bacterium]|nr:hypothetical protein [Leptospiraceae bacterium]
MSVKKERVIKINRWTEGIKNSNEKRVLNHLKGLLIESHYRSISWNKERFQKFFSDVLNNLPTRYKQKNSIEISGRLSNEVIIDAIRESLKDILISEGLPLPPESSEKKQQDEIKIEESRPEEVEVLTSTETESSSELHTESEETNTSPVLPPESEDTETDPVLPSEPEDSETTPVSPSESQEVIEEAKPAENKEIEEGYD